MPAAWAQVWHGREEFRLTEVDLPRLAENEVLVEIEVATVCGSDRHTVSGKRPGACPSVLGHEGAGRVVATERDGVKVGDRVVFAVTSVCGTCLRCRRGITAKCGNVRKVGHEQFSGGWLLSGTYATHIHLPAGVAVSALPGHVTSDIGSTAGCAVATVMAMMEAAGQVEGRNVLVNGVGMLGVAAVSAARAAGARVIACDPNPVARELVRGLAHEVVDTLDSQRFDITFELSGTTAGAAACVSTLDVGGVGVLAGTVAPVGALPLDPEWVVRGWRTITGVHNYEPRHLTEAVAFLGQHGELLPWDQLLGRRYALADLSLAFSRSSGATRDVVVPA